VSADRPDSLPPFRTVAIVGLGVMGGSLARALRAAPERPHVVGFSRDRADRTHALDSGAIDEAPDELERVVAEAELVVYAVPLRAILELQTRHVSVWRPDAVVSDLSSLKVPVTVQARALGIEGRYVSAHPMAGGEGSGFAGSRDGVFRDAAVWLSGGDAPVDVRTRVERFWTGVGARPAWIEPEVHDARMAHVSHLPQLLANALARHLERHGLARSELGPGGRDMTRLAGSSPSMWRDLLEHGAAELAPALREIGADLESLAGQLEAHDVEAVTRLMERTRAWSGRATGTPPAALPGASRGHAEGATPDREGSS
jgi:prephenate dehydrogenase